jgi:uroporphyrinogen decarboxylase
MNKRFESCYQIAEKALEAANGKVDILWIGDDFGTQEGLLVSPDMWRDLFFDKIKSMCDLGHKYGAKVMLHSCGSTRKVWADLIEAGVEIYDTVQPEAKGMDSAELKEEFGDKMCFHGTISTQQTLPFGTPEDVTDEVRRRIETVGKNGGFILAPAHNLQPDTPLENIFAMYDAVRNSA